jgi:hypothetical protein
MSPEQIREATLAPLLAPLPPVSDAALSQLFATQPGRVSPRQGIEGSIQEAPKPRGGGSTQLESDDDSEGARPSRASTLGPVQREKGGCVGMARLYLQVARLVSTYVLLCCLVLFVSQWHASPPPPPTHQHDLLLHHATSTTSAATPPRTRLSLSINLTPLGSYSGAGLLLPPPALALLLPPLWLFGAFWVSVYSQLLSDAARPQFLGYTRTVVAPGLIALPAACAANALRRRCGGRRGRGSAGAGGAGEEAEAEAEDAWPVRFEHGLFSLSSKPWRATMQVGPRLQLAFDVACVVALHLFPLLIALWVADEGYLPTLQNDDLRRMDILRVRLDRRAAVTWLLTSP